MVLREVFDGQSGLPVPNSTNSYWHKEPSKKLYGHRTTKDLPETADIIVVGSGITGSFAAHFLKNGDARDAKVVMLEAREACWGATGRNGGHCQPVLYATRPGVAAFELETYHFLKKFVEDNDVPCDWVSLRGVHAYMTQDLFDVAAKAAALLQKENPDLGAQVKVVRPGTGSASERETLASLRVPGIKGAIVQQNAASCWPYKLVAWVLEQLLETYPASGFNLQTNTPVTGLKKATDGNGWVLTTPRGTITAKKVILCTNAYTSRLLPAFSDLIVPTRGQVAALLPPKAKAEDPVVELDHSYNFLGVPPPVAFREDYLVQRPLPNGELIFGGGRSSAAGSGVGEWRDDVVEEPVAKWLRSKLSPPLDLKPGRPGEKKTADRKDGMLDASFEWTGIMGYSRDHNPWVGAVPESLGGGGSDGGLFICAGYTGHGMPVATLAAREAVRKMFGGGKTAEGTSCLPEEYELTEKRLEIARKHFKTVAESKLDGSAGHFTSLKLHDAMDSL